MLHNVRKIVEDRK